MQPKIQQKYFMKAVSAAMAFMSYVDRCSLQQYLLLHALEKVLY